MRPWLWLLALCACAPAAGGSAARSPTQLSQVAVQPRSRPSPTPSGVPGALLRAHNAYRARHCAKPLRWSDELARAAQRWAAQLARKGCMLAHSDTALGENLAGATRGALSADALVELWYQEVEHYRFRRGGFSMRTGHFTQLVWGSTRLVGCGSSECNGLEIWVCHYDPPGNVEGTYREEVLPTSCRK